MYINFQILSYIENDIDKLREIINTENVPKNVAEGILSDLKNNVEKMIED